ncbi:UNVERIFIED_ORG: hypothetical protein M2193_002780 [Bradyrhizobium japonicum]|jgi:hypothetical protein
MMPLAGDRPRKATRKLSGFDRVPDLTAWLRCGATSINRK